MTPEEQEKLITELQKELERLHALYNQYFMGIEKLEPLVQRKAVERKIQRLRKEQVRNTALRFRMQSQIQKFNTESNHWRRVCKQIEDGTYRPHIMLAKHRSEARDSAMKEGRISDLPSDAAPDPLFPMDSTPAPVVRLSDTGLGLDDPFDSIPASSLLGSSDPMESLDDPFGDGLKGSDDRRGSRPATTDEKETDDFATVNEDELQDFFAKASPRPPKRQTSSPLSPVPPKATNEVPKPPQPPASAKVSADQGSRVAPRPPIADDKGAEKKGLDNERAKAIYRTYLAARKKCDESTDNLSFEKVSRTLNKTYASSSGSVEFKVVIRNGKAAIKTVKK